MGDRFETIGRRVGRFARSLMQGGVGPAQRHDADAAFQRTVHEIVAAEAALRRDLGSVIAESKRIGLRDARLERESSARSDEARQALAAGRNDLARAAVERQIDIEAQRAALRRLASDNVLALKTCEDRLATVAASRRDAEASLAEFKRSMTPGQAGSGRQDDTAERLAAARGAIARITGQPSAPIDRDGHASALAEIADIRREADVADRLARLRSGAP